MALNDVIKEARQRQNLKQEDAAALLDVTVQTYSKWENGITEPKASQVAQLSDILSVSTDMICSGKQPDKLDKIDFIREVSQHIKQRSEFDLVETIWRHIQDDSKFIDALNRLDDAQQYEAIVTMKKRLN
ncbi:helix-turn-helix domain-containing protein [Pseudomonadota bacterium]|nr:helix-turn-helix domain-containing protein [Pseudomonadota bacterium]